MSNTINGYLNEETSVTTSLKDKQKKVDFDIHQSHQIVAKMLENIRTHAMKYSKKLNKKRKKREDEAIKRVIEARNRLNNMQNPDEETTKEYEEARMSLSMMNDQKAANASKRNARQYAIYGEKVTRYNFQRLGRGRQARRIPYLNINTDEGAQRIEGSEVSEEMFRMYEKVIAVNPIAGTMSIEEFLGEELAQTVRNCPQEESENMTKPISVKELEKIVKQLKTSSAPGPLGITNNLLKEIFPYISEILADMGNKILFQDTMPQVDKYFFHRMVVFLLKPNKDGTNPDSYRGISLLEVVYKLFSKILADRIKEPLKHIQSKQQYGFTEGKTSMEASRTVLEIIKNARMERKSLVVISTDFRKAFDSISLDHSEKCLEFYSFPDKFVKACMRFVRKGTVSFEVNSMVSQDYELKAGVGQGDPKSGNLYNLSAAPLNHYLSHAESVPRYKIDEEETEPVYYADDELLLLDGGSAEPIVQTIRKIEEFQKVSGLHLNISKCAIMDINCEEGIIQEIINETGMTRCNKFKHLGLVIDNLGKLPNEDNIQPIIRKMKRLSNTLNTDTSSPLGRAIYANFLLASRYVHKLQNLMPSMQVRKELWDEILNLTWTKHRIGEDNNYKRVHIAKDRVSQPIRYGGLGVVDPNIQMRGIAVAWIRRIYSGESINECKWKKLLEGHLRLLRAPDLSLLGQVGYGDWKRTARKLELEHPFWANIFNEGAEMIKLTHKKYRQWEVIPLLGHESFPDDYLDRGSLSVFNGDARQLLEAGLKNVGQLFHNDNNGRIMINRKRSIAELENEFGIRINVNLGVTLNTLAGSIITKYRSQMDTPNSSNLTTMQSVFRRWKKGSGFYTKMILWERRTEWEWGHYPRSFWTYRQQGLIDMESEDFIKEMSTVKKMLVSPSIRWTALQIYIRTLWTKKKESRSTRGVVADTCDNCKRGTEDTKHLFVECSIAKKVWEVIQEVYNDLEIEEEPVPEITLNRDDILFHSFNRVNNKNLRDMLKEVIAIGKHVIYRTKFRENLQRAAKPKPILMHIVFEVEKVIINRSFSNKSNPALRTFLKKLRENLGF